MTKNTFLKITLALTLILGSVTIVNAQVSNNLWKLSASSLIPALSSWTVGNSSTNATFGNLTVSSCTGCGGGGGGGADGNWVYINNSGIRLATTTNQVLIGGSATTSSQNLQVQGSAYVSGLVGLGTTTPSARLDINNASNVNTALYVEGGASGVTIAQFSRRVGGNADIKINASASNPQIVFALSGSDKHSIGYDSVNTGLAIAPGVVGTNNEIIIKDTTGNVGIGTSSPGQLLAVAGDILGNNHIGSYFTATSTVTPSVLPYASTTAFTSSGSAFISATSASGSLSVGTTTTGAGARMLVAAGVNPIPVIFDSTSATGLYTIYRNSNTDLGYIGAGAVLFPATNGALTDFAIRTSGRLAFGIGTTERMGITSAGVFMGTTTTLAVTSQLSVQNAGSNTNIIQGYATGGSTSVFSVSNNGSGTFSGSLSANAGANMTAVSSSGIDFSGGTLAPRITFGASNVNSPRLYRGGVATNEFILGNGTNTNSFGKLGIGTTSPWAMVSISTSSPVNSSAAFFAIASTTGATATSTVFVVDGMGEVGIGLDNPRNMLVVKGGIQASTTTAKPTCNADNRIMFWGVRGGAGVKDTVEVCAKDAADAYAWRTLY